MYIAGLERCEKKKPREKGANKYQKSRRIFFGEEQKINSQISLGPDI
jgi:hypothetical protein